MINIIAPNKEETQKFAQKRCNDYNPSHFANNSKQIVPGDWAVERYIIRNMCSQGTANFEFKDMIKPLDRLIIKSDGIYRIDNLKNPLVSISRYNEIDIENGEINDMLRSEPINTLGQHYCLTSGDINTTIDSTLKQAGLQRNEEKSVFWYTNSQIILTNCPSKLRNLERKIETPDISNLKIKKNGGSGKITFKFPLFNYEDSTQVGLIKKTVACLRLDKYTPFMSQRVYEEEQLRTGIPRLGQQYLEK